MECTPEEEAPHKPLVPTFQDRVHSLEEAEGGTWKHRRDVDFGHFLEMVLKGGDRECQEGRPDEKSPR